jgi:hypothetical protein
MISESAHALLSASGSHKWLHCTPSARLEATLPEAQSDYADEGRLAHEIGELKLRKAFIEPIGTRTYNSRLKKLQEKPLYQDEMLRHTDTYMDYISKVVHGFSSPPYIAIEKKLDYGTYAPEGFGTGDCIIIGGNTLRICDLKYGKGVPVSADMNPQMMLYALGALSEYAILYAIEKIVMTIIQPRLDSISECELSTADLLSWGESIKPVAQKAYEGLGEFVPGDYCQFCRAKATCRARAEANLKLTDEFCFMKPPLISNEEVGQILERAQNLAKWAKNLEEYALNEILAGSVVPGWKAVAGRSNRQFADVDQAFKILTSTGMDEAMLYKRQPITLTETEKLVGPAKFKVLLDAFVIKPPGKPALAPLSDKRDAYTRITAEEAFGNINNSNENGGLENE